MVLISLDVGPQHTVPGPFIPPSDDHTVLIKQKQSVANMSLIISSQSQFSFLHLPKGWTQPSPLAEQLNVATPGPNS